MTAKLVSADMEMTDRQLTDEELVERIRNGDRESLDILIKSYFPMVYSKVQCLVPEPDAEDVTQEIFLSLVASIDRFQGSSTFSTWFYRITRNKVADHYRRVSRRRKTGSEGEREPELLDPREWIDRELALREAIAKVPSHYRKILLMRFTEGLSYKDIAKRLELTYDATIYRYRRAICMVREKIG